MSPVRIGSAALYKLIMKNGLLFPLFSFPLVCFELEENFSIFDYVKNECEYDSNNLSPSEVSIDKYIFDKFPKEKNIVMKYFYSFKNEIMRYENTEFCMTTSWATRLQNTGSIQLHNHSNSFYSGILYLDDIDTNEGRLEFNDLSSNQLQPNKPVEYNIWNSTSWYVQPKKNLLIFFPSRLHHKVSKYNSDTPRHSIAFNIFMDGFFGTGDSVLNINHHP